MRATKEVVRQKIIAARDLIKCHSLTPELATELFTRKGMGVFRFSAALIEWSESKLNDVKRCDCASKPISTLGTCHGQQHFTVRGSRAHLQEAHWGHRRP